MSSEQQQSAQGGAQFSVLRPEPVVIALVFTNVCIELILQLADQGILGSPAWRGVTYHNGAFWAGLLDNWRANYPLQPGLMFFSYAFLHAGLSHLIGNMLTLLFLGILLKDRISQLGFMCIYIASALAGGLGYAVLGESYQPMVGASGAIFGLAGALVMWELINCMKQGQSTLQVWRDITGLVLLNVIVWYALDGVLAWEAHLGGFLGGAVVALAYRERNRNGADV